MPVDIVIDEKNGLVVRKLTGEVSVDEIIASFAATICRPDYQPGMNTLVDLTAYTHQNDTADMRKIADFFLAHRDRVKGARAAVVVSQTVSFGMVRMLQTFLDRTQMLLEVFYDLGEARAWLGLDPELAGRALTDA